MELSEFWTICSLNGIVLDKEQLRGIERYRDELVYWNQKVNLISRKDEEEVLSRHILHSLTILKYVDIKNKAKCLDVGTGGGLPGIPIKLIRQDLDLTLIDSIAKKIKITEMLAKHTGLKRINAFCVRAEEIAGNPVIGSILYDIVFARAVAKMEKVLGWIKNVLKEDGKVVFLKGGDLTEEFIESRKLFPGINIEEIKINFAGAEWFVQDEKKVVVCTKIN